MSASTVIRTFTTLAVAVVASIALFGAASPAGAAVGDQLTRGQITLFSNPDFTGQRTSVFYTECGASPGRSVRQVGSYHNHPIAGCQVVLRNQRGAEHVLCAGRAVVPSEFRQAPRLQIRPGVSRPCPIVVPA